MTYMNSLCADIGSVNCPCPLAETGDCLVCGRLSERGTCDCLWAGVCVYNEYVQNGSVIRTRRDNKPVRILKKIWYDSDLLVMVLRVSKGFALKAAQPGSFVFVNAKGRGEFSNVPVSVMKAEPDEGRLSIALKIISGKTKAIAGEKDELLLRGVYRNGLLGHGLEGMKEDIMAGAAGNGKNAGAGNARPRWLVITKGIGFAPSVNLLRRSAGAVDIDFLTDTEKINGEIVADCLQSEAKPLNADIRFKRIDLNEAVGELENELAKGRKPLLAGRYGTDDYDRVIVLTSDYFIKTLSEYMDIPSHKLVFCNNFRMCCGEGVCGACGHMRGNGEVSKMCKCRDAEVSELL